MEVIFNKTRVKTTLINMYRESAGPFCSSQGPLDQSPSKVLENWRNGFAFKDFLKNLVGIEVDTTSTIRWQRFNILRSKMKVDVFGSALAISGGFPSENIIRVAQYYLGGGNRLVKSAEKVLAIS